MEKKFIRLYEVLRHACNEAQAASITDEVINHYESITGNTLNGDEIKKGCSECRIEPIIDFNKLNGWNKNEETMTVDYAKVNAMVHDAVVQIIISIEDETQQGMFFAWIEQGSDFNFLF